LPVGVADLERILRLEPAGVVDEDVNFARGGKNRLAALRRRDITRRCVETRSRRLGLQRRYRLGDTLRSASVNHHLGPVLREAAGDGLTYASGGAGNEGAKSFEIDLHKNHLWSFIARTGQERRVR
jgi:hypothetical protein